MTGTNGTRPAPGYIRLSRKIITDPWWEPHRPRTKIEAWIDLLMWARFADGETAYCGEPVTLRRGEFIASYSFLAERWRWTPKAVRSFLSTCLRKDRLRLQTQAKHRAQSRAQSAAQLPPIRAQHRAQLATVYLIVNYDKYNPVSLMPGIVAGTVAGDLGTGKGTTKGTKKKEGKKEGKETIGGGAAPEANGQGSWIAEAVDVYRENIGFRDYGEMGKVLKPVVDLYGWPTVKSALQTYGRWRPLQRRDGTYPDTLIGAEKNVRFCSPIDFVHTFTVWHEMNAPADLTRHA